MHADCVDPAAPGGKERCALCSTMVHLECFRHFNDIDDNWDRRIFCGPDLTCLYADNSKVCGAQEVCLGAETNEEVAFSRKCGHSSHFSCLHLPCSLCEGELVYPGDTGVVSHTDIICRRLRHRLLLGLCLGLGCLCTKCDVVYCLLVSM